MSFDPSSDDSVVAFLNVAFLSCKPQQIKAALREVVDARTSSFEVGTTEIGRQVLYNALSENGNPTLETLLAVLSALGLELPVQKRAA
jgi:probable addiction module antidote protein